MLLSVIWGNAATDAGHASIRRTLKAHSAQARGVLFTHMSATRTCQQFRKLHRTNLLGKRHRAYIPDVPQIVPMSGHVRDDTSRLKNPSYAGAWRAFVREQPIGRKTSPSLFALGAAYKTVSVADMNRMRDLGRKGVVASKNGATTSFGPKCRDVNARANKKAT